MMTHNLKLKAEYVEQVMLGEKTFELRKNDRDFKVGDLIHFTDTNGKELFWKNEIGALRMREYIFEDNLFRINYILKDVPEYGLDKDYCILSIVRVYLA